jgi:hypothetical protein
MQMKKIIVLSFLAIVCGSVFYSCTKEEVKSVDEIILGRWKFNGYSTELGAKPSVELQRLVDSVLYYYAKHHVIDDFSKIIEFTNGGIYMYDASADSLGRVSFGTYFIAGDSINITANNAEVTGLPIRSAKIWANGNDWFTLSLDIAQYLDLDAAFAKIILSEERKNKLKNGRLILLFERYSLKTE